MNNVNLVGRHAKDPELRYTANGTAVCNFTLAVRNPFDKEGNADFIDCVAWGTGAELVAENHVKGNMMGVEGRISKRNYENNEGNMVYVTEVNVNSITLIQTKDYAEQQNNKGNNGNGNNKNNGSGNSNGNNKNNGNGNNKNNGNNNNLNNGNGNNNNGNSNSNRNSGNGNRNNRQNL